MRRDARRASLPMECKPRDMDGCEARTLDKHNTIADPTRWTFGFRSGLCGAHAAPQEAILRTECMDGGPQ